MYGQGDKENKMYEIALATEIIGSIKCKAAPIEWKEVIDNRYKRKGAILKQSCTCTNMRDICFEDIGYEFDSSQHIVAAVILHNNYPIVYIGVGVDIGEHGGGITISGIKAGVGDFNINEGTAKIIEI